MKRSDLAENCVRLRGVPPSSRGRARGGGGGGGGAPHCSTTAPGWKVAMTWDMMGLNRRWNVTSSVPSRRGTFTL